MPLSSNSLIHFTNKKAHLKGILKDNFQVFNCRETIVLGGKPNATIIPMVSFCDIPLSEIKDHISKYGNYGIGMTKEWAIKQRLNPVLYMAQTSMLSESYRNAWNDLMDRSLDHDKWTDEEIQLCDVLRYIKNYEGDLTRKGKKTKHNYRFSDEREWRYAPPYSDDYEFLVSSKWYDHKGNKALCDGKLASLRLGFEVKDIKYIIIDNDNEISEFINHLRKAKGNKYTLEEVEKLTTRILTVDQIKSDI